MWIKWLPWRFVISRAAKSQGFIDPISVLSHLHRLAQPSEVTEPIELLRAGMVLHARGLINSGTIQHNLDWVWPYWVERQFNPRDNSFIPRAFSITHVNLTHRNWTAVGLPDCEYLPIVDPRGLVTPLLDGWSLDAWLITDDGQRLFPSRQETAEQELRTGEAMAVCTRVGNAERALETRVDVIEYADLPACRIQYEADASQNGWLVVALRPVNPEGVSLIHEVQAYDPERWTVDRDAEIHFSRIPDKISMASYRDGDVAQALDSPPEVRSMHCNVGMVTAVAMFRLDSDSPNHVSVKVPLNHHASWGERLKRVTRPAARQQQPNPRSWPAELATACEIVTPNKKWNQLFDAAVSNMVLHAPGDVFPGPYTYKRFWFRDAAFILNGLLAANLTPRVGRVIERFPSRQTRGGYFHSQEGEWDSNGEALWIIERYHRATNQALSPKLRDAVLAGAKWICRKRLRDSTDVHAGLMPAGFSAEHLGPNDFYYWDDFWSVAGLECAARLVRAAAPDQAEEFAADADALRKAIDRSIYLTRQRRASSDIIPAAPERRMDAGAIGSLAGSYPLQIWLPNDARMLATVDFLLNNCCVQGGFFQDMIHSGINPYLTLHLAQVLLRSGTDDQQRFVQLVQAVADLASSTGQWPEAIHPITHGGCMGDGQHIWAAAEWVLMLRNMFVREEADTLILGSGIPRAWLRAPGALRLGPTATLWGPISVEFASDGQEVEIQWQADWHASPPPIRVELPATAARTCDAASSCRVSLADVREGVR